jgi:hypothetical protein
MKFSKAQIEEACKWFEKSLPKHDESVILALKDAHESVSESYWKASSKELKKLKYKKAIAEFAYQYGWRPKMKNIKTKATLNVAGNGLWSNVERTVQVHNMAVHYYIDNGTEENFVPKWGELRVFFTKKTWHPDKHGLIYTDRRFLRELKSCLSQLKIDGKVDYSEQGMQGDNYVSLDVDRKFINSWISQNRTVKVTVY